MAGEVRTRFAPSPTGYLHIGGARTALYNWLFAKAQGGKFILRIEDTDKNRSTEEAIEAIISSMKFLGLNWDEGPEAGGDKGPYRQTERLAIYQGKAAELLEAGAAYRCYCSPEELKRRREALLKKGLPPKYDRKCLGLSEGQSREREKKGEKPTLRLHTPDEKETVIQDLIRGKVAFDNKVLDDFIILRSDGTPTYNFAVVVDDALMNITHVIRGEDHLSNTPKQIFVYQALNLIPPSFAHLPMIVGEDKKPLSKRHGAVDVGEFKRLGYLKEALINYIALLGWSYDEATTLFSASELIEKFSLDRVSSSPAFFDMEKLNWMNGHYIRKMSITELTKKCLPFLKEAEFIGEEVSQDRFDWLKEIISLEQERIKSLSEITRAIDFFFAEDLEYDSKSVEKVLKKQETAGKVLDLAKERLESLDDFGREAVEKTLRDLQQELDLKPKFVFQPIRVAVTGRMVSPPLFETIALLGKDKTLSRLNSAISLI